MNVDFYREWLDGDSAFTTTYEEYLEQEVVELRSLFDLQHTRMLEATEFWQKETGNVYHPDLGHLLKWLMNHVPSND